MRDLLNQISVKAIELGDFEYTQEQIENIWLGTKPASEKEIQLTEKRLEIEFPTDYRKFLSITNGFSAPNSIEPTFHPINKIDYLKNIDSFLIEAYSIDGIENIGSELEKSIIIGGINEEQYFLLIPPNLSSPRWKYWKFANWHPGEVEHDNLESYFKEVLHFLNKSIE
ncbi:SMI1/KNR4 family protein [Winogradskyella echinorum]|uniref:SMI1/KNR4 family protein n=1 Tax=Winogradskyella echinorum TaxID=538189 RepID=A0ABR6Y180_9FLAO|nr:SMI1/KNR4 family protein [Winogradskyella echinorum]MBC3846497.1 SMI1/KNR4 family protein [Winogradskyella echinorum]MBC5750845.1 SMI1/KNR4 family protein [Winogradskyella echinorum]